MRAGDQRFIWRGISLILATGGVALGQQPAGTARNAESAPVKKAAIKDVDADKSKPERASGENGRDKARAPQNSGKTSSVDDQSAVIQEPSQGRPIFITSGETFYFVMRLPADISGDISFALRHAMETEIRVALKPTTPPSYNEQYCSLLLQIPGTVEPGLYDVEVKTERGIFASRRSVKVVDAFKSKFRFVHLSNMNVGDLTAPAFDEMLPREINVLAPEFIVATGDYTEWARARDDAGSWTRVLKFFEQFNAPVFLLCGAHDHEASFTKMVASKPVDKIDYGNYHGLLLLDHPANPIDQDISQIQWIENDLRRNKGRKFNFLCANSDELSLIDIWREGGKLADFIKDHKIKLFIAGGSSDWDYKEFADKLKDAGGMQFVRTHQSSTALRDLATGVSHYRVIEVDGDQVAYTYPDDTAAEKLQHSIPTGRLRTYYEVPNDGSQSRVVATVQNALNQSFAEAHLWLRVAKRGGERPSVSPGQLVQTLDCGKYWACDVAVTLPDKGAVRVMAATNAEDVPPALPIDVAFEGSREWVFSKQTSDFGLAFSTCDAPASLKLTNRGKSPLTCRPVVRVNGSELHVDRKAAPRMPLTLEAGQSVSLPLVLDLRRVSPGMHSVQVFFLEDPLARLTTFDVMLSSKS